MLAVLNFGTAIAHAQSAAGSGSRVPLYFEENRGQTAGQVRFLARAPGYTAYLTGRETVLQYRKPGQKGGKEAVVRLTLPGSQSPSSIRGAGRLPGIVNYLIGNDPSQWQTRIPTYSEVDYAGVYPGVDLAYRSAGTQLEFDFRVAPGADAQQIRLAYAGASQMHMNASGDMVLDTDAGPATIFKPVVYQEVEEKRVLVAANYRLLSNGEVGFQLGKYDHTRQLVVDPTIGPSVSYGTYLGSGTGGDTFGASGAGGGLAVDSAGEAFICGTTTATNFPVSGGAYRTTFPAGIATVGFVTALNATGTAIKYSTYISGTSTSSSVSNNGTPAAIAVDANGFAFVGGQTDDPTFPSVKPFQSTIPSLVGAPSNYDHTVGMVFELSQNGSSLVYSSFLGGGDPDNVINAIAVDGSDNAYVTGNVQVYTNGGTGSHSSNFPVTSGVIWGHYNQPDIGAGFEDSFAAKISPPTTGNATLSYSTVIGSTTASVPLTYGTAIAVDPSGNAYVTGTTDGDVGDHGGTITTKHSMTNATSFGEYTPQVYVLELNSGATTAVYLDYLGGSTPSSTYSPQTSVAGIAVDSSGNAYVTGTTEATNFQTTTGAYQTSARLAGQTSNSVELSDAYVTVIAAGGASLMYSTYLDGTFADITDGAVNYGNYGTPFIGGIAVGSNGQFWVAGVASTTNFPIIFPTYPGGAALHNTFPGCALCTSPANNYANVGFLTEFPAGGGTPNYSVFVGAGSESIYALNGVATNGTDVWVMEGEPTAGLATTGAYNTTDTNNADELILRVQDGPAGSSTSPTTTVVSSSPTTSSTYGQSVTFTATVTSSGNPVTAGTVTFTDTTTSTTLDSDVPLNSSGEASVTLSTLAAGSHTIAATYNPDSAHTTSNNSEGFSVGKASLTITASSTTMTYGGTPPGVTPGYSAFAGSDTVNSLATAPTCSTTASNTTPAGTDTGANTCSGAVDDNYNFTYVAGNVTVNKASLTITASSTSMTYGGTPPAVTPGYSAFAGTDTVNSLTTAPTCSTTASNTTPAGTDTGANTCSGAVDNNYTISYVAGNVTVGKASLTITASNTSMTYGGTPPGVTPGYSAFAGTDTVNSLTTAPTCSTTASNTTPAGTDTGANTCSGAVDNNYNFTYVAGNVTVGKASLTITASSTSMTYGGTPPAVSPGYSAFAGTDTVNSLTTAPTCVTSASNTTPAGTDTGANTCSGAVDRKSVV